MYSTDKKWASDADAEDPLRLFRDRFLFPKHRGSDVVYLCGNSLGLQPKTTRAYLDQELKDWENLGVEGHFHAKHPWMPYHEFLTDQTARLVGALPSEVVVMNSLTVNLHLMMVSFYRPTKERFKIVIEKHAFPSDQYAVKSQIRFHGLDPETALLEVGPRDGESIIRTEDVESLIKKEGKAIALVLFGGVNYYSGQAFEMNRITKAAHAEGSLVGFDLAHAAGNLTLQLHDWDTDFAVWCTYKYLNSGPGGIAGCFVHERHIKDPSVHRMAGWWGHDKSTRFFMGPDFQPIPSAEGWQLSNPPIFQLAALRASLDIFDEAGMENLRAKSKKLTGYLEFLIRQSSRKDIEIITPGDPEQRGCQLSLRIPAGGKILFEKLSKNGVVCDWREPDVIRVAPAPLYNSFGDVYRFYEVLEQI